VINTASVVPYRDGVSARHYLMQCGYGWSGPGVGEYNFANIRFMLEVARDMEAVCRKPG
jgi:hypothetical protein